MSGIRPRVGYKIISKPPPASSALLTRSSGISLSINLLSCNDFRMLVAA
jgi:hypothetical protein